MNKQTRKDWIWYVKDTYNIWVRWNIWRNKLSRNKQISNAYKSPIEVNIYVMGFSFSCMEGCKQETIVQCLVFSIRLDSQSGNSSVSYYKRWLGIKSIPLRNPEKTMDDYSLTVVVNIHTGYVHSSQRRTVGEFIYWKQINKKI